MAARPATFRKLPWRERWWLAQSLVLLPVTALALRVVPLRRLRVVFDRPRSKRRDNDVTRATRIAHMVAAAAEYGPYRATCLPQSLVLQLLLRNDGMRGELKYGVRKVDDTVAAHCWVELDGAPLIDSPDVHRRFAVLEPSAPAARWVR
jgi:hypothetical protein